MFHIKLRSKENAKVRIIWIHGWDNTHANMILLANLFANQTENYAVDLIGFGKSPELSKIYSTKDHAEDIKKFILSLPDKKTIIVGHSHGGRVAIQLSNIMKIDGIILLGGAGIPLKHSIFFKIYLFFVKKLSFLKKCFPFLTKFFGSDEYKKTTGLKRETFKQIISEDLRNESKKITIPTLLLYGDIDTATPPYMGEEYNKNIKNSEFYIIKGANHWDLLDSSILRVHYHITKFIREKL
jgi:pimeloyl-ACP methyl ester carboxylesterase